MGLMYIIAIAVSVALDAFIVSIAYGVELKKLTIKHFFIIALFFSGFQVLMPIFGILLTNSIKKYILSFDHWVVFGILLIIGFKMIYDSIWVDEKVFNLKVFNYKILFFLAVATSIDAFSIGLTLSLLSCNIPLSLFLIGIITFLFVFTGVYIGKTIGNILNLKLDVFGGIVLILIGVKVLIEHLSGGVC